MDDQLTRLIAEVLNEKEELSDKTNKEYQEYIKFIEMKSYENALYNNHVAHVAGIDEVGRGPLAGPVMACCVILPQQFYLPGLNDSKKLSKKKREHYYQIIIDQAVSYGIGVVTVEEIDRYNIYASTKLAMKRAIEALTVTPEHLLIDAMVLEDVPINQTKIIKGDTLSISIAAASVVAKVTRDRYMAQLDEQYPVYQFKNNQGYGTKAHLEAIHACGIIDEHRKTFEPVKSKIKSTRTLFDF